MGALDWVILFLVAAAFIAAVVYSVKHKGSCGSCSGDCASCGKSCSQGTKAKKKSRK